MCFKLNVFESLPDVFRIKDFQNALGISKYAAYMFIQRNKIPHIKIGKTIVLFKQFICEWINKKVFTKIHNLQIIKSLPNSLNPKFLISFLNISKGKVYELVDRCYRVGKRIVLHKDDFISLMERYAVNLA